MQKRTTPGEEGPYKFETNTFSLEVNYTDQKLSIKMKDFNDWVIYEKEYTDEDIGKGEIHRKVDLSELYNILTLKIGKDDEKKMQELAQNQQQVHEYKFGDIVKSNNIDCYKIERGGKITACRNIFQAGNFTKQIKYNSVLILNKMRSMSQIQLFSERNLIDKKLERKILIKQIQKLKQENSLIREQYNTMKSQNKSMKEQMDKVRQKMNENEQKLDKQLQKYQNKITRDRNQNKMLYLFLVNQTYLSKFKLTHNNSTVVEYVGQDKTFTKFIFNENILYNEMYTFKIRILKTKSKIIMVGVVDYIKEKQKRYSFNSNNAVAYHASGGYKYSVGQTDGTGFSQGQTLEIKVDLTNKTIKWSVNGQQRASYTHEMLGDQSRIFMPYVQLYRTNDSIQFV